MARKEGRAAAPGLIILIKELLKLATLVNRPMREGVAEPLDASLDELKIIMCLGDLGPMAGHKIAEVMVIPPMNVSRALVELKTRGWIEPAPDAADRRRKPVRLTKLGTEVFDNTRPRLAAVATDLFQDLTVAEQAELFKAVTAISARIEA